MATIRDEITAEIHDLHDFFVSWFRGDVEETELAFTRVERALGEDFQMIPPSGEVVDRAGLVAMLKRSYGSQSQKRFEIEVRSVREPVLLADQGYFVLYEEWQWRGDVQSARVSTAWLRRNGQADWTWRFVHETWMTVTKAGD